MSYHDRWFWIDDRDYQSKKLFSFLMFVMTLTETGGKEGAPIVTIGAGGVICVRCSCSASARDL